MIARTLNPRSSVRLRGSPHVASVVLLPDCLWLQYTILVEGEKRNDLQQFLKEKGIDSAIYYPLPLHQQECFNYLSHNSSELTNAENASQKVLSLPVFPEMRKEEIEYVCEGIRQFFSYWMMEELKMTNPKTSRGMSKDKAQMSNQAQNPKTKGMTKPKCQIKSKTKTITKRNTI